MLGLAFVPNATLPKMVAMSPAGTELGRNRLLSSSAAGGKAAVASDCGIFSAWLIADIYLDGVISELATRRS